MDRYPLSPILFRLDQKTLMNHRCRHEQSIDATPPIPLSYTKKEKSKIGHNRRRSQTTDCPQPSEASMSNTFNRDGYYFEGEKIYYRDVFITNRNETITVIMDIDPDAPSIIRHGDPKLMGPTI